VAGENSYDRVSWSGRFAPSIRMPMSRPRAPALHPWRRAPRARTATPALAREAKGPRASWQVQTDTRANGPTDGLAFPAGRERTRAREGLRTKSARGASPGTHRNRSFKESERTRAQGARTATPPAPRRSRRRDRGRGGRIAGSMTVATGHARGRGQANPLTRRRLSFAAFARQGICSNLCCCWYS
jgi:hypothetical protein